MSRQPTPSATVATHPYAAIDAEGRWLWLIAHMGPGLLAEQQARAAVLGGIVIDRRTDTVGRTWAPGVGRRLARGPELHPPGRQRAAPACPWTRPAVTVGAGGRYG